MAERHLETIRKLLRGYAQRGVVRGLTERTVRGKSEFSFTWIHDKSFTLVYDDGAASLSLKNALPRVESNSLLYGDIRGFVRNASAKSLPAHRRIDAGRAVLSCANRGGVVTFRMAVKRNQFSYGLKGLLNFGNQLFGYLDMNHIQYLWENFDVPEE